MLLASFLGCAVYVVRLRYARCEIALCTLRGLKAIFSAVLYVLASQCLLFLVALWIILTAILAISHIVSYSS